MAGPIYDATVAYLRDRDLDLDEDPAEDTVSFTVSLPDAEWHVYAWARDDASELLVHSVLPYHVPVERRTEAALFLTRANLGLSLGNWELDLDDGEVRFKTCLDLNGEPPVPGLIKPQFDANLYTTHTYLAGLAAVVGGVDAAAAIKLAEPSASTDPTPSTETVEPPPAAKRGRRTGS